MNEHLAHFLFAREQVDVRILGKYGADEDPYQIGMLEKADVFLSIYQPVTCGNVPVRCISISSGPFAMLLIVPV